MGKIIFFTGGARSGKSKFAEEYIKNENYKEKLYFATSIPFDDEMKNRIKKHIKMRGKTWKTVELFSKNELDFVTNKTLPDNTKAYSLIEQAKKSINSNDEVILFDCITNFVSNRMFEETFDWDRVGQDFVNEVETKILDEMNNFLKYIRTKKIDCVFVTNELGMGLVPSYPLGRYFRDICGNVNQLVANEADEAYLAVSGIKLKIK